MPIIETLQSSVDLHESSVRLVEKRSNLLAFPRNRMAFRIVFVVCRNVARCGHYAVETLFETFRSLDCRSAQLTQSRTGIAWCAGSSHIGQSISGDDTP